MTEISSRRPDGLAYHVRDSEQGKSYFNRIGTVYEHRDGVGFNIFLDASPVDGRITVRMLKEQEAAHGQGQDPKPDPQAVQQVKESLRAQHEQQPEQEQELDRAA